MGALRKIQLQIKRKDKEAALLKEEINVLQSQLDEKKDELNKIVSFLEGMNTAVSHFDTDGSISKVNELRKGSRLHKIWQILKAHKTPMHINEILNTLGIEPTKENKHSVSGSINRLVRLGSHFAKTDPGTFTLVEYVKSESSDTVTDPEHTEDSNLIYSVK